MEDLGFINRKLDGSLHTCIESYWFPTPSLPFVSPPLGLLPKHDGDFCRIYHLSYPKGRLVNNNRQGGAGKTKFQKVVDLIFKAGGNCVVVGRDVNDAFREISHTKRRVSFRLSAAPFIFNPFSKGLHWLLAAYLYWVLCHYLDSFVVILSANITPGRIQLESNSYHWLTDLLGIP